MGVNVDRDQILVPHRGSPRGVRTVCRGRARPRQISYQCKVSRPSVPPTPETVLEHAPMPPSMPSDTANRTVGAPAAAGDATLQPPFADRPDLVIEIDGPVAHLRLNRAHKRNAISDALIAQLHAFFANVPEQVGAVLLSGEGKHFCAGLDLSEMSELSVEQGIAHSRMWHAALDAIQF
ncbi:MAG: enoyl-CoA hydratase/isomerase family protein, partial [Burkholderiales bacterium]